MIRSRLALAQKLRVIEKATNGLQMSRLGLTAGLQGIEPERNLESYMEAYEVGQDIREALEWLELLKLDSESPEGT